MTRTRALREATRKADLYGGEYVVVRRPADSDDAFHGDPGQVDADGHVYATVRPDHASRLLSGLWELVPQATANGPTEQLKGMFPTNPDTPPAVEIQPGLSIRTSHTVGKIDADAAWRAYEGERDTTVNCRFMCGDCGFASTQVKDVADHDCPGPPPRPDPADDEPDACPECGHPYEEES